VTAVDLAPALLQTASRLAATEDLPIRFDVGDAEQLPYPDGSFDVVASAHGVVFAPDHRAAARELARVCVPGGRLGITAWRPGPGGDGFQRTLERFTGPRTPGPMPRDWGHEQHATELLGDAFELEFVPEVWIQVGDSGEAIWRLLTSWSPPFKALAESLDAATRDELHAAWVEYFEGHRRGEAIRASHEYMLITGTRRGR